MTPEQFYKDKSILITGGCGFIGSELSRQLAAISVQVVVADNLANGKIENLTSIPQDKLTVQVVDIRDSDGMRPLVKDADIIFHLACLGVRHSIHSPIENNEVNASATLELLSMARDLGVDRFIHVSSSEIYGTAVRVPMNEDTPPFPHTVYGSSKLAGECHARAYAKTYCLPTVVLRPFNSYGPNCHHEGDSGEVIPKFMLRALAGFPMLIFGDGSQTRDFSYVEDTARGILLAGSSAKAVGQTINLGAGSETTINELSSLIAEVTGASEASVKHIEPRPGDILRLFADSTRAENLLGFRPQYDLRSGLQKLLFWYQNRELPPEKLLKDDQIKNWLPQDFPLEK